MTQQEKATQMEKTITTGKANSPASALQARVGFDPELDAQLTKLINRAKGFGAHRRNCAEDGESVAPKTYSKFMQARRDCATALVEVFGEVLPEGWDA